MCYPHGSFDQSMGACPMCKVFRPSGAKCPHIRDICRNRSSHPRFDVVFLTNAEVKSFKGCGYCKWAKTNPPTSMSGLLNPGWPGCCRPPTPSEQRYIQPADWHSVSVVHSVPMPAEIKSLLDSLTSKSSQSASGGGRGPLPLMDRRNSSNTNINKTTSSSPKSSPVSPPPKIRSGDSPQLAQSSLGKTDNRVISSPPSISQMDQYATQRRQSGEQADKRSPSSRDSPNRKHLELESSISRRSSNSRRTTISSGTPFIPPTKSTADLPGDTQAPLPSLRRGQSASNANLPAKSSPPNSRSGDRQSSSLSPRASSKRPSLEVSMANVHISSSISSSSSGSGGSSCGSMTDSTVTSDGGFTDYLSDESEAELQRQAEVKAAIFAQNHAEEQEFKAARQQLASVDLRPPKSWNPASGGSRLQPASLNAYAMAQASASTRG